jgi:hypothetical protein
MRAVAGLLVNAMLDLVIDPKGDAASYSRDLIAVSDQIFKTSKKGVVTDMSGYEPPKSIWVTETPRP